jgi:hypothetical protein
MPKMFFLVNRSKKNNVEALCQDFVEFSCCSRSWAKKQLSQQEKEQTKFKSTLLLFAEVFFSFNFFCQKFVVI